MKSQSLPYRPVQAVRARPQESSATKATLLALWALLVVFLVFMTLRALEQPVGSQKQAVRDVLTHEQARLDAAIDAATR